MLLERRTPWPARLDVPLRRPPSLDGAAAIVSFIGHSTFLIQTAAGNILTDPDLLAARQPVQLRRAAARSTAGDRVRRSAADLDRPAQPQPLRSLRPADARPAGAADRSDRGDAARQRAAGAVGRADQGRGTGLVAGGDVGALADHADAGASFLGERAVRSQPRAVGRILAGGRRQAHLLRRRHRLCAVLSRGAAAARSDRSGAAADRRLRAALVHGRGAHESRRRRCRPISSSARPRASRCTSARSS